MIQAADALRLYWPVPEAPTVLHVLRVELHPGRWRSERGSKFNGRVSIKEYGLSRTPCETIRGLYLLAHPLQECDEARTAGPTCEQAMQTAGVGLCENGWTGLIMCQSAQ